MPRLSRKAIEAKYYHIMIQGINRSYIFNNDKLKTKISKTIFDKAKENNIIIIAYCIMDNHAHLLAKTNTVKDLSKMMASVNTSYAKYYNFINDRVGYVFRDRYRAEAIYSINQLQNCIRYIHENPVKAHMVLNAKDYKYSSIKDYCQNNINPEIILETYGDCVDYMDKISGVYEDYSFIEIDNEYGEMKCEDFDLVCKEYEDCDFQNEEIVYKVATQIKRRCRTTNEYIYKFMNLKRATYYNIIRKMKKLDF